jgi:hypothetical protein
MHKRLKTRTQSVQNESAIFLVIVINYENINIKGIE